MTKRRQSKRAQVRRGTPKREAPLQASALSSAFKFSTAERRAAVERLLANLKASLPTLEALLRENDDHWGYEDRVYRFYHQSFKVFGMQDATTTIVAALRALAPDLALNPWFLQIVADGTGKSFELEHNRRWLEVTRPIVEAFFHARFFLDMAVRYGKELDTPPEVLPSGWAALLYLYQLR